MGKNWRGIILLAFLASGALTFLADAVLVQAAPASISASLTTGPPGTTVTITGSGFSANETAISVAYDSLTVASGIQASPQGGWSATFTVPASASGPHNIIASGSNTSPVSLTFVVTAAITLSPTTGIPGTPVTVTGAGFGSSETGITITYDGAAAASGIRADPQGRWSTNFPVPSSASGPHRVVATGSSASPGLTFLVTPSVTVSPTTGVPGTQVTVTGSGFGAGETDVTVTYDGSAVVSGLSSSVVGGWSATFSVPPSAAGPHTIRASSSLTSATADITFTITARVSISRTSGAPGTSVTVTGGGFGANETGITITFDGSQVASNILASPQGSWSSTLSIPPSSAGPHTLRIRGAVTQSIPDTTFIVTPTISVNRAGGAPGNPVTVSGSGFGSSESGIAVVYDGVPVAQAISANPQGAWSTTFAIPDSPFGSHTIRASGPGSASLATPDVNVTVVPTISLSKTSGPPGSSLTVTGAGFIANESGITLTYDGTTVASGIRANAQGGWTATLTIPNSPSGTHSIQALGSGGPTDVTSVVIFTATPGLSLSPTSGPPGSSVTVIGSGFGAGETGITATYDGVVVASNIRANAQGSWNASFTIPPSASGPHAIDAYGATTLPAATPDVSFSTAPSLSTNQASGTPGTSITVTGFGFAAGETGITVTYDSVAVASGVQANAQGSWNVTFAVPPSAFGPHSIGASGTTTQSTAVSQASFTSTPIVTLSPATGNVGSKAQVSGSGFAANTPIRFTYDNTDLPAESIPADATGSFSKLITIPPSRAGSHTIVVADSRNNNAKAVFTMDSTPPPMPVPQSPADGTRIGINGGITPSFTWSTVTDPSGLTYHLQIDTNPDFAQPVLNKTGVTANHYTLSAAEALPLGVYYWRVSAVDGASNQSAWSSAQLLRSGLLPLSTLIGLILLAALALSVFAYFFLVRLPKKRPEVAALPQGATTGALPSGQLLAIEAPHDASGRALPWRLALSGPSEGAKVLSTEEQARLTVVADFARSLPLVEPGYTVGWLTDLLETGMGIQLSPTVYEQLLKGEIEAHYKPAWLGHPRYQDLNTLLEGQTVLQDLSSFVDGVSRCAAKATSLLRDIHGDTTAEIPTGLLDRGGWAYVAAVYGDALGWFRGTKLREPSERDYTVKPRPNPAGKGKELWLHGEETTSFPGPLIKVADEAEASRFRTVHVRLRRDYRGNGKASEVVEMLSQLEVQRTRLLSVFSQLSLKQ